MLFVRRRTSFLAGALKLADASRLTATRHVRVSIPTIRSSVSVLVSTFRLCLNARMSVSTATSGPSFRSRSVSRPKYCHWPCSRCQWVGLGLNLVAYSICRIRIGIRESSESSFDADSLAKPEVLSSRMTTHQHRQRKQTKLTSNSTTFTNPDHSICQ